MSIDTLPLRKGRIDDETESRIAAMLGVGGVQRRIAEQLGVSRHAVRRMAFGGVTPTGRVCKEISRAVSDQERDIEQRIVEMLRVGGSPTRIANHLGVSYKRVIHLANKHRLRRPPKRRIPAATERHIVRMLHAGMPVREIAAESGVGVSTVNDIAALALGPENRRRLSQEVREEIVSLIRAGVPQSRIAERFGVSPNTIWKLRKSLGMPIQKRRLLTEEQIDWALRYLEDGASYCEVARTIGIDHRSLARRFPGYGWTKETTAEFNRVLRNFDPDNHSMDVFELAFAKLRAEQVAA